MGKSEKGSKIYITFLDLATPDRANCGRSNFSFCSGFLLVAQTQIRKREKSPEETKRPRSAFFPKFIRTMMLVIKERRREEEGKEF